MKNRNKDFMCPSLNGTRKLPTCEDETFERSIVAAIVSNFYNNADKIGIRHTFFGDRNKRGEGLFDKIK